MTFKEKLMQEHPGKARLSESSIGIKCPWRYGYESKDKSIENCIRNSGNGCEYCWNREMPEERNDDTKNLKEKMEITTLVLLRDGRLGLIFKNPFSKDEKGIYNPKSNGCITFLGWYNDDLTCENGRNYDIVKVKFPDNGDNYYFVKLFFDKDGDIELPSTFKWDWECKEEPITKDVSLEELNAILKEKFPDIDKFNLPIKE